MFYSPKADVRHVIWHRDFPKIGMEFPEMTPRTTPYLTAKAQGDNRMVLKRRTQKAALCVALQVLRNMAKAPRPEVKSPGVHSGPGDTSLKLPQHNIPMFNPRMGNSGVVCHLTMSQGKVMSNCLSYAIVSC